MSIRNSPSSVNPVPEPCVQVRSGAWQEHVEMEDYRSERIGSYYVERATWSASAEPLTRADTTVAAPGYTWFRFWLLDTGQLADQYYDTQGNRVGMLIPVCTPLVRQGAGLVAHWLLLALWMGPWGSLRVLYEDEFDQAAGEGRLASHHVAAGEDRVRALTLAVAEGRFPPAFVRNFAMSLAKDAP